MKKIVLSLFLILVNLMIGSTMVVLAGDKINYSKEEISDFGFENGYGDYWILNGTENAIVLDKEVSYEGKNSIKIGMEGKYTVDVVQYVNGLKPGYYYLELNTLNEGNQEYCYIYAAGTGQDKCMTAVPRTIRDREWNKVTVRGIKIEEDGVLELGVCSKGEKQFLNVDNSQLHYEVRQNEQYKMLRGGCISWLDWVEELGGKYYYSDGREADALQIMAESGLDFVRLELYNNPGDFVKDGEVFPKGHKDQDSIFDLAVRAHEKGMKIQLSFMYSDYWGNDIVPLDWKEKIEGIEDPDEITKILTDCLYKFTKDYMQRLADAGIYPQYVSLGNEMQGGILMPYSGTSGTKQQLEAFCMFMDAGYRAVKEVSPESQVVLHIACNADDMFWESRIGTGRWFFDLCKHNNIKYDVIGTSFYPFWAQTDSKYALKSGLEVSDFLAWCNMMIEYYDKDILLMETGFNWGTPGQLGNNGAYEDIYPYTPEGQRDYMYELLNAVKSVKDGRCVGMLYWDPVLVRQEGVGYCLEAATGKPKANCVETTTFFDYQHKALPVLDAYKYNVISDGEVVLCGIAKDENENIIANSRATIEYDGNVYTVNTDRYGMYYMKIDRPKSIPALLEQEIVTICNKTLKYKTLQKKKVTFSLGAKTSGKGKLTYKVTKGSKKNLTVSKTGKVIVQKGCKKGVYHITITAAETEEYKKAEKIVVIRVK